MLHYCRMGHVNDIYSILRKVSFALALHKTTFTYRHPMLGATTYSTYSTFGNHDDSRNNTTTALALQIEDHAVVRIPLCIPQQPWGALPESVLNSKQNYLPRPERRVCPRAITSDHTVLTHHRRSWTIPRTDLLTGLVS